MWRPRPWGFVMERERLREVPSLSPTSSFTFDYKTELISSNIGRRTKWNWGFLQTSILGCFMLALLKHRMHSKVSLCEFHISCFSPNLSGEWIFMLPLWIFPCERWMDFHVAPLNICSCIADDFPGQGRVMGRWWETRDRASIIASPASISIS